MSESRPKNASDPASTTVMPARFAVSHDEHGTPKIEVIDASFEQVYQLEDAYSTMLFVALCRSRGLLPYRRARQRESTICIRASLSEHEALWASHLSLSRQMHARLCEVAHAFVHAHAPGPKE